MIVERCSRTVPPRESFSHSEENETKVSRTEHQLVRSFVRLTSLCCFISRQSMGICSCCMRDEEKNAVKVFAEEMIQCDECDNAQVITRVSISRRDESRTNANVTMAMARLTTMCCGVSEGRGRESDDSVRISSFSFAHLSLRRFFALSALLLSRGRCSDSSSMFHFSVVPWRCQ